MMLIIDSHTHTINFFAATTAKLVNSHREWLLKQPKLKTNEKKRQGAIKSYSDIFGMEGSFRQLEFD